MVPVYRLLTGPIKSPFQAQRAAEASAYVWVAIAILFGFAFLANLGGSSDGGMPPWAPHLILAVCMVGLAFLVHRQKTVFLAIVTLVCAGLISAWALLALAGGKGNFIVIPLFVLPFAIRGLKGARMLRSLSTPAT